MPELIQNPIRRDFLKGSNCLRIRKIGIWVEPFASTEQGIWSEYQSPVRSSFYISKFLWWFFPTSLPKWAAVSWCRPGAGKVFQLQFYEVCENISQSRWFPYLWFGKGLKHYCTWERYSFRWWVSEAWFLATKQPGAGPGWEMLQPSQDRYAGVVGADSSQMYCLA